jgi:hypothetical protein
MTKLFHVSDQTGIEVFYPRPVPNPDAGVRGEAVWAVDEAHLPNYLLPRDCPRVTYAANAATSPQDRDKFLNSANRVVALEMGWKSRIETTELFLYEFPARGFELIDAGAGYFISRKEVVPKACTKLGNPLLLLKEKNVEVQFHEDLWELRDAVVESTLEFSVIRFRFAKPKD